MLQTLWSLKGGVGVSVSAAALATSLAHRGQDTLLVDLAGDQPALLGLAEPAGPGVLDWLVARGEPDSLGRLRVPVVDRLGLLPAGRGAVDGRDPGRLDAGRLAAALEGLAEHVVVDAGVVGGRFTVGGHAELVAGLADAGRSLLVTRACYLALRRGVQEPPRADGVVLVADAGRGLDRHDVAAVLGLPVLAVLESDPSVARRVDAGLVARRPLRLLERGLRELV